MIKVKELIQTTGILEEVLPQVATKLEGTNVKEILGITDKQLERIEKKLAEKITSQLEQGVKDALVKGEAVEFPQNFLVLPTESTVRKNEDGTPVKKLSLRTRKAMKDTLNN